MGTTEARFQTKVIHWLTMNGIYCVKQNASGLSKVGIPDLLTNMDGLFVAIELKKDDKSKVTDLQRFNINKINKSNGLAVVLRPSKFETFKIHVKIFLLDATYNRVETFKEQLISRIGVE